MEPVPPAGWQPRTVLVVDDKAENRELVRASLEPRYRVIEADSGHTALDLIAEGREVDLVLLDVMMPGLSGLEVCREIKRNAAGTFLPVILLTALDAQEDRNAGLAAGADDFLTKPVDRRELTLRIRAFLKLREQEQLIHRQIEELYELTALKDDLVSLIVHDLRNPLTGLLGHLELVRLKLDPTSQKHMEIALRSAGRIREAVDDLLDVRLLEERQVRPDLELLPVTDVIKDALAMLEGTSRDVGVGIELNNACNVSVLLDRRLVRRSVENLVANALKYSPQGEIVTVSLRSAAEGVEIEVADRGPGIPDALKAHVFEKFGSVESSRGQARRGYGLGLYMVRLVADLHGGQVTVHDRAEGGTRFSVILPFQDRAAEVQCNESSRG